MLAVSPTHSTKLQNSAGACRSRVLAFEDYENALKKSANIVTILDNSLDTLSSEISDATASVKADRSELDGLRRTIKDKSNIGALNAELRNLRAALNEIGVDVGSGAADAAAARGWRATLEARIAEIEGRIARLSELAKEVVRLPPLIQEGQDLRAQLESGDARRSTAEQAKASVQQQLDAIRKRVAEIAAQIRQAQSALDNLKWVRDQRPGYASALNSLTAQTERLNRTTEAIAADRNRLATASTDLQQKSTQLATLVERRSSANKRSADLAALRAALSPWQASTDRLAEIRQQEAYLNEALQELRKAEPTLQAQLDASATQQAALERVIADADRSQSELRQLLSQLQKHITDGNCPLCGVDHGSQNELVRHLQMTLDSAGTARTELAGLRQDIQGTTRKLAGNREAQRSAQAQLSELASERIARDHEIRLWADNANGLGLNVSVGWVGLARQIANVSAEARKEIEDRDADVRNATESRDAAKSIVDALTKIISQQESTRTAVNAELEQIRKGLTTLRSDPRLSGMTMDSSDDELNELEQERSGRLDQLRQSHAAATEEQARLQGLIDAESRTTAELARQLPILRTRANENEQARKGIIARLTEAELPEDSDEQELVGKLGDETQALARLRALHQRVASVEIGLNAATTAAALARLEANITAKEKIIAEKKASRSARSPWRDYFASTEKILSDEQAGAIANFTRQYGPRTSVIQRRLRSVYGFDDVEIIMRPGDRIAIKSSYTRKHDLPFDNRGSTVSVMAIKAVGTITHNFDDGARIRVDWKNDSSVREWYFYTHRGTIWRVLPGDWKADALIAFTFQDKPQDIERFCNAPRWSERFGTAPDKKRFRWTKFYEAIADKLLTFRNDRQALIAGLREIAERLEGLGYLSEDRYADGSKGFLRDICPFTTMGTFNRGITQANRKKIAAELAMRPSRSQHPPRPLRWH